MNNDRAETRCQLDALHLAEALKSRLVDFSADDNHTPDPELNRIFRRIWGGPPQNGGLVGDLWVEGAFPAKASSETLASLVEKGTFDRSLAAVLHESDAVPNDRRLYCHQLEAILAARNESSSGRRPAVVVTAGTGAGKTESFLLPALDDLYRHQRDAPGVRCLILYPMNALVNDQVDRLYGWLAGQDRVSMFHFTSETPEDATSANRQGVPEWERCRARTRKEARKLEPRDGVIRTHVPDIVITNYSMLEYMLCRPQDGVFFGPALRTVILDEAHLYTGTLAAEISLLLRRLYDRCGIDGENVLTLATSATLGSGDQVELAKFASGIFSKPVDSVRIISGQATRPEMGPVAPVLPPVIPAQLLDVEWFREPFIEADSMGEPHLVESAEICGRLRRDLACLSSVSERKEEQTPAALLYHCLRSSEVVHRLEEVLWERQRLPLVDLANLLWGVDGYDAVRATAVLLNLAASARTSATAYPLIPHRLHLLARPADGLSVCLSRNCDGPEENRLPPLGTVVDSRVDRCPHCSGAALSLYRCGNCGEWVLAGVSHGSRYAPPLPRESGITFFTTKQEHLSDGNSLEGRLDYREARLVGSGAHGLWVRSVEDCPRCGNDSRDGVFKPIRCGEALTLPIIAETLLAELPPFPGPQRQFLPADGRRLLAFSDSRQEAARLGPRLTRQHELQLLRAAIVQLLDWLPEGDPDTIAYLEASLEDMPARIEQAGDGLRRQLMKEAALKRQQLEQARVGVAIDDLGAELARSPAIAQLLSADDGAKHHATNVDKKGKKHAWNQSDWEANTRAVAKTLTSRLGGELATPSWRAISLETLGLIEITYPSLSVLNLPPALAGVLPTEACRDSLETAWPSLLAALCDSLRVAGAITLGNSEDDAFESGGVPIGRWMSKDAVGSGLVAFVGKTGKQIRRRFVGAVLRGCGLDSEASAELSPVVLRAAFDLLLQHAIFDNGVAAADQFPWLQRKQRQSEAGTPVDAVRIDFQRLTLRKPAELFRCTRTGHVWPRSVAGCAPELGCEQTLERVTPADLDGSPRLGRLRREYLVSPVFKIALWAEEHSAQLNPAENRRLQDLFKAGVRNILSATTTLELGIDIGGLSLALMGNVPPGKANYLQRAGRAGRRADGSAAVVTFARSRPFDREVFRRFGDYLEQPLRRPVVLLERGRIVRRHFHAYLLGEFFREQNAPGAHRGAMQAFGSMGKFCGKPTVPYWKNESSVSVSDSSKGLEAEFIDYLFEMKDRATPETRTRVAKLFRESAIADEVADLPTAVESARIAFCRAIDDWRMDFDSLLSAWNEAVQTEDGKAHANSIRYQLSLLSELTVIEALADRQFLPSYGFPIGIHRLRVIVPDEARPGRVREEDQFRLERSGLLAVAEYVPGSQVQAGGKLIRSRGLLKHWTGVSLDSSPGLRGRFCECVNDHFYYWIEAEPEVCPLCGGDPKRNPQDILFVRHGYTTAAWDPPKWRTNVERVGSAESICITFRPADRDFPSTPEAAFAGIAGLRIDYRDDGKLLVFNRGERGAGFAICLKCGYADVETTTDGRGLGVMRLPAGFNSHARIDSRNDSKRCWFNVDHPPLLRHQILAAQVTTDVLLIDFTACLGHAASDVGLMVTLAYALRNAAARLLELDARELGTLVVPTGTAGSTNGVVLYDSVPGGAGHVLELKTLGDDLVRETIKVLYVDADHHARCESGCLDCLLSFDAQAAMARQPFVRREAYEALTRLSGGVVM
jgi:hypothetical protein